MGITVGRWYGRVCLVSYNQTSLNMESAGKSKMGQPRNSWRRDTEIEMNKLDMSWTDVKRKAHSCVHWHSVVGCTCIIL